MIDGGSDLSGVTTDLGQLEALANQDWEYTATGLINGL